MAESRRGKRFYFTRGQLFILGVGFTAAVVIIFFLGMLVGKGIEEGKMSQVAEPVAKIPVNPNTQGPTPTSPGAPKEELTFYDTLTKSPAEQPPPVTKTQETRGADEVTPIDVEPPAPKQETLVTEKTEEKKAEATATPPTTAADERKPAGQSWTVQVNAFPDENSAKIWVDRLKNKGYNAYVTEVRVKDKIWYRVRVGHYDTRAEAEKVEETLKNKENFAKAFATSR